MKVVLDLLLAPCFFACLKKRLKKQQQQQNGGNGENGEKIKKFVVQMCCLNDAPLHERKKSTHTHPEIKTHRFASSEDLRLISQF